MPIFVLAALFIVGLLVAGIEFGRRLRLRSRDEKFSSGLGVIDGAVFGLMALLLGFSFSGAVSRFDARRELIVQERTPSVRPGYASTYCPTRRSPRSAMTFAPILTPASPSTKTWVPTAPRPRTNWLFQKNCRTISGRSQSPRRSKLPRLPF